MKIAGKVAVITGGSSGIGQAVVRAFIEKGGRAAIFDLNEIAGEAMVKEAGGLPQSSPRRMWPMRVQWLQRLRRPWPRSAPFTCESIALASAARTRHSARMAHFPLGGVE